MNLACRSPLRSLALMFGVVGILIVFAAGHAERHVVVDACPLEQQWYTGDHHFWQEVLFSPDGTGSWVSGGMGMTAPHERIDFRWTRDGSRLTAVANGESRTVGYETKPHRDYCFLHLDDVFVPVEHQARLYSNTR